MRNTHTGPFCEHETYEYSLKELTWNLAVSRQKEHTPPTIRAALDKWSRNPNNLGGNSTRWDQISILKKELRPPGCWGEPICSGQSRPEHASSATSEVCICWRPTCQAGADWAEQASGRVMLWRIIRQVSRMFSYDHVSIPPTSLEFPPASLFRQLWTLPNMATRLRPPPPCSSCMSWPFKIGKHKSFAFAHSMVFHQACI